MKRDMINISLQRYGTRMLQAGDTFEANRRDARVLHALKKARFAGDEEDAAVEPPVAPQADELQSLRAQYQQISGKKPFHGWDAPTLLEKIATAGAGDA